MVVREKAIQKTKRMANKGQRKKETGLSRILSRSSAS